jgi:lipopolysaccharide/colanic/teichoic acid biosynthesis glycosyltransferase
MLRRFVEGTLAFLTLLFLSPLFCTVAIGIRLSSPGPIFYRAMRVWLHNGRFTMYKFRTMHTDQRAFKSRITADQDPRVFPLGALLRLTKIDELPQLFNILKGEMSFVGPRPEDPFFVENHYRPEDFKVLGILPGLTSPGSLYNYTHGEKLLDPADPEISYVRNVLETRIALDLVYAREQSWHYDLRLVARTLWIMLCIIAGRAVFPQPPEMKRLEIAKTTLIGA